MSADGQAPAPAAGARHGRPGGGGGRAPVAVRDTRKAKPDRPADTDMAHAMWLTVDRPQTRAEWVRWYAARHATRRGLFRRGSGDLAADYGVDADTVYQTALRWGGPLPPAGDFAKLFGHCPYADEPAATA